MLNYRTLETIKSDPLPPDVELDHSLIAKLIIRGAYQQDCLDESGARIPAEISYFDDDPAMILHCYYTAGFTRDPKPGVPAYQQFCATTHRPLTLMFFPGGLGLEDPDNERAAVQHFDQKTGALIKSVNHCPNKAQDKRNQEGAMSIKERDNIYAQIGEHNRVSTDDVELPDFLRPLEIFDLKPAWF